MKERIIMHIDVNSAYLSWQAVYNLQQGSTIDLREIPSVVGGSQEDRRGIVLAKSIPAKAFDIKTGEVLWKVKQRCPDIVIVPPNYTIYMRCSKALYELLNQYFPIIQRFSVDEFFIDYTGMETNHGTAVEAAHFIKNKIKEELGFTVNIGIGRSKLMAKMAGELKKPDMVHTLWPHEMETKMWPLPVEELYMVGRKTHRKLNHLNIFTIGDLAKADPKLLMDKLKSFGHLIWCYANGIEESAVFNGSHIPMKGMGNSSTIKFDVEDRETAFKILLSLTESVAFRLRESHCCSSVVAISLRNSELHTYSHQRKLFSPTNVTNEIYRVVKELFDECWQGEKLRHLGVRVTDLSKEEVIQTSLFDEKCNEKYRALDESIDQLREKYGKYSIIRGIFADGEISPLLGGVGEEDYPMMSSIL
ncbi:DNA polymerase Y family protein [Alkaliphilus peptidifermentans]|uniref:DNA polymerase IV n=1 Tax=Alkaliphilus peptidifermentans DSM 18978 TaxID=1120976 RepID=A0A1G5L809_9FIRM|nr:DNA polymerase IV [Alkaliphilus peptidifermentans]SCZ08468.1 DNA polymerase-4 [Alkaliphilus peptidifermentans DSM 18978]